MKLPKNMNFQDLGQAVDVFTQSQFRLRFEIGPTKLGKWKDADGNLLNDVLSKGEDFNGELFDRYPFENEEYFNQAFIRAVSIFEAVFSSNDAVTLLYQKYSDGRQKIRKGNLIFRQVKDAKNKTAEHSAVKDVAYFGNKSACWRQVCWANLTIEDINYKNIFLSIINMDFGGRKPIIYGDWFFMNLTKGIILHLYDDRGMDVVGSSVEVLSDLYKSHNSWILDYDRARIDSVFSPQ